MKENFGQNNELSPDLSCRQAVRALIKNFNWALLPETELVRLVLETAPGEVNLSTLEELIKKQYAIVMYKACQQTDDPVQRKRAYLELSHFLYGVAYKRWPDLAEIVVDRALALIYEKLHKCHQPDTFFAFAFFKLWQASTEELRAREKLGDSFEVIGEETLKDESPQPFDEAERQRVLIEALNRLRNERQKKVIFWKYFEGISDEEIGTRLGITTGFVRKLRHDGLVQLRKDPQLRSYFLDG